MTISTFKRRFPSLIRQVEKEERKKFLQKPSLHLHNARPRSEQIVHKTKRNGRVTGASKVKVFLNRRMARDREQVAILSAKHEFRELLLEQHGVSQTRAHRRAQKKEETDRRALGLKKSYGWYAREFWKPKSRSLRL